MCMAYGIFCIVRFTKQYSRQWLMAHMRRMAHGPWPGGSFWIWVWDPGCGIGRGRGCGGRGSALGHMPRSSSATAPRSCAWPGPDVVFEFDQVDLVVLKRRLLVRTCLPHAHVLLARPATLALADCCFSRYSQRLYHGSVGRESGASIMAPEGVRASDQLLLQPVPAC
jgi:hypothetical protein